MTNQEINEAVARKLGCKVISGGKLIVRPDAIDEAPDYMPDYCHSIEAAWEVVEHLKNHSVSIHKTDPTSVWLCSIFSWDGYPRASERKEEVEAEADTAPMAICLSFLKLEEPK